MSHENMLMSLIAVTFFAVIAWAIWQKIRTQMGGRRHPTPCTRIKQKVSFLCAVTYRARIGRPLHLSNSSRSGGLAVAIDASGTHLDALSAIHP